MRGIVIACVVATLLSFVCTAELQVPEHVSQDSTDGKGMLSAHAAKNNFAQEENLQVATQPVTGNAELAQEETQVGWGHGRKLLGSSRRRRRRYVRRRRWWGSYQERSAKNQARERSAKERNNKAERQNKERSAKEKASKQENANKAAEERKVKKAASEKKAKAEKNAKAEKSAKLKKERSDKEQQRRRAEKKDKQERQKKEQQQKESTAKEKHSKKIEKEKKIEEKSNKQAEKKKKYVKKLELDKKKAHELAKKGKEKKAKDAAEKAQKEKEKGIKLQKELDQKAVTREKTQKTKTAEKKKKHEKGYKTNERSVKKMKVKRCMSKWRCGISGLSTPVSVDPTTGDVRCMSSNGKDCWWGKCQGSKVPYHGNLAPLICGAMHKKKWGGTGYGTKGHWCNKVKMPVTKMCSGPTWKKCADEHKYCKCNGAIRYGKGTKWSKPRKASGTVKCGNSVFGDPLYGTFKECQCMKVSRMHAKAVNAGSIVAFQGGRGGKMCADEGHRVVCNRPWIKSWEKFGVMSGGKGRIALKGGRSGKICADEINTIRCNRGWIKGWEKFKAVLVGRNVALMGGHGNKYCADDINGVKCNRPWIKGWEKFTAHTLYTKRPPVTCDPNKAKREANAKLAKALKKAIKFEPNKTTLRKNSYGTLNGVVKTLAQFPWLEVTIVGHSSAMGSYCKMLTTGRAQTVIKYLQGKGVKNKMSPKGECGKMIAVEIVAAGGSAPVPHAAIAKCKKAKKERAEKTKAKSFEQVESMVEEEEPVA